ncbi:hypothetical protein EST38_g14199 [Candolleomyces aberdarensis]|uniref:Uncharacterized protein n=1 Tax=Candolleomyces aberdarensis TaxID=2316362 RepID=A0A4Q2CXX2_9AGAR|nr:hypothetical protein EST38_g14199 [Candolleomyces aberdarensis]
MTAIATYCPTQPELHLTLPHDHANSILSTSPFSYRLDDEFDFVEILPTHVGEESRYALDASLVAAITWAATRTKQMMNRATQGRVATAVVGAAIPDYMFKNLGMEKPRLALLLENTNINPLLNIGEKDRLKRMFRGLQQLGREAIDWIVEARWRSLLLGDRSLWNWEDPRQFPRLAHIVQDPRLLALPAPASSTPSENGSDTNATVYTTPPNSPTLAFSTHLFENIPGPQEDVDLLLQIVLHPTASRYAMKFPDTNVFDGRTLVNNGYVDSDSEDDAMEVDHE